MHRSILASVVVFSLFPHALPVCAQPVGDKVVVISDSVEIKARLDCCDLASRFARSRRSKSVVASFWLAEFEWPPLPMRSWQL